MPFISLTITHKLPAPCRPVANVIEKSSESSWIMGPKTWDIFTYDCGFERANCEI